MGKTVKKEEEEKKIQDTIGVQPTEIENNSDSLKYDNGVMDINKKMREFADFCSENLNTDKQFDDAFEMHKTISDLIEKFMPEKEGVSNQTVKSFKNSWSTDLDKNYTLLLKQYNKWTNDEIKMLNENVKKNQVIQFTASTISLTIFTFIIGNLSVLKEASLKIVLTVNLALLTISIALFSFIGIFMGFSENTKFGRKHPIWLVIILLALFVICLGSLIFVAVFMEA